MTANGTFANGLLTATYAAATLASQVVALKKGTYALVGTVNRATSDVLPSIVVTGATDGIVLTHRPAAVVSADNSKADAIDSNTARFTIASDQNVTFVNNVMDAAAPSTPKIGIARMRYILTAASANTYPVLRNT